MVQRAESIGSGKAADETAAHWLRTCPNAGNRRPRVGLDFKPVAAGLVPAWTDLKDADSGLELDSAGHKGPGYRTCAGAAGHKGPGYPLLCR